MSSQHPAILPSRCRFFNKEYFLTLQNDFKGAFILVSTPISCSVGNDGRGVKRVR